MPYRSLKAPLRELLYRAGKIMTGTAFTVREKGDAANLVTTADLAVQEFLVRELAVLFPEAGFFCEEEDLADTESEWRWIIDPIDGTTNFAHGLRDCAISVALARRSEVMLGGVYAPYHEELFLAVRGEGATCNGRAIHVSDRPLSHGLFCTSLPIYAKHLARPCVALIEEIFPLCRDIRRTGSCAMDLCYLASGRCELYFELRIYPWDCAAAYLILEEAGGILRTLGDTRPPLNGPAPILAANSQENYRRLSALVARHIPPAAQ